MKTDCCLREKPIRTEGTFSDTSVAYHQVTEGPGWSLTVKERYTIIRELAPRYQRAGKGERSKILDEFARLTDLVRSYASHSPSSGLTMTPTITIISSRFLREATNHHSFRFLHEATRHAASGYFIDPSYPP
jgi:hypothetical protein